MTIQRIKYADRDQRFIKVFTENSEWVTAWPCETADLVEVKEALSSGMIIEDFETDADIEANQAEKRKVEIYAELDRLDLVSVRPLRAISSGIGSDEDIDKLKLIESQVTILREELKTLA